MDFIKAIEKSCNKKANIEFLPMQKGDVPATIADISETEKDLGFKPLTNIEEGIENFVKWYKEYHASEVEHAAI